MGFFQALVLITMEGPIFENLKIVFLDTFGDEYTRYFYLIIYNILLYNIWKREAKTDTPVLQQLHKLVYFNHKLVTLTIN